MSIRRDDIARLSGSSEYAQYLLRARRQFEQGHAATIKQVREVYRNAAAGIRDDIQSLTPGTLRHAHLTALQAKLDSRASQISKEVLAATHHGIWMASGAGSQGVTQVTQYMLGDAFPAPAVARLFAGINERATLAMLARTRRDGLKISDRVWRTSEAARNSVRMIVEDAVVRGQDARKTARLVQQYLQPGVWKALKLETRRRLGVGTDVSYQAMRLARTEMNNAFHEGMVAANQHSPGYRGIYWRLSGGFRVPDVCDDMAADMSYGEPGFYPKGFEPVRPHPNCVPAGTVVSGSKVIGSTTRWYEGEIVEIETVGGRNLTITPNHPILTSEGWVLAGLLHEGSNIICSCGQQGGVFPSSAGLFDPNDYQVPALVEDVASFFGGSDGVTTSSVPVAAVDFHGDGIGSKVCIIRAKSLLRDSDNVSFGKPLPEDQFVLRDSELPFFTGLGDFTPVLESVRNASDGIISRLSVAPVILGSEACMNEPLGFLECASLNTLFFQNTGDNIPADVEYLSQPFFGFSGKIAGSDIPSIGGSPYAFINDRNITVLQETINSIHGHSEILSDIFHRDSSQVLIDNVLIAGRNPFRGTNGRFDAGTNTNIALFQKSSDSVGTDFILLGQSIQRYAGQVLLDKVRSIRRKPFAGHVYNLQTVSGWYVANDIITHNCRCVPIPAYENPEQFAERLRSWQQNPRLQPDIERWYNEDARRFMGRTIII